MSAEGGSVKTETWIDRTDWAAGPWDDEPDRAEWELSGLPCLAIRQPSSGHWCGYVGLPAEHPWYGRHYSCHEDDCHDWPCAHSVDVDVHGGLTYADHCMEDERPARERVCHVTEGEDKRWWLGFDCRHYRDRAPGAEARDRALAVELRAKGDPAADLFDGRPDFDSEYRTLRYVQGEVAGMVRQVLAAR